MPNRSHAVLRPLLCLLVCGALTTKVTHAELPPSAYEGMMSKAPEELEIQITRVAINKRDGKDLRDISVYADAKVTKVMRSKSRLKVGDKISLRYMTFEVITTGWAGPGPIPTVASGKRYHAYLKKAGSNFYPAARGRSLQDAQ